ncbi:hypothetical protein KDH_01330 [Dictyobacter sp. S3.2.2.5]|uniref:Integral membrane bound transporter domain-containing protein n=2 Tax=Dictyobacter halimunensis TaxID=3026934 RepID=A0ABQ6FH15_9CHLR|nr:hypothetical protein KDH_01330 [Dictyobacter sp. S3.2.2.5]
MDMSQAMVLTALRGAVGIVLPLAVGLTTGHIVEGATVAGGTALWTVMNTTNPNHARLRVLFLSCVSMGIGAFIGSLIGTLPILPILIVGAVAFVAGLLAAVSLSVAMIGMQSLVAVLFLQSFARDPLHAFLQAALVFAGALLAFLLEILLSPWRRTGAERKMLSLFFERLAEMAGATDDNLGVHNKVLRAALVQSQAILLDRDDHRPQGRALFALYGEAERMRLLLIVLHRLKQELRETSSEPEEGIISLEHLLQELSRKLRSVSQHLILRSDASFRETGAEQLRSNEKIETLLSQAQQWQASSPELQARVQNILVYAQRATRLLYRIECLAQTWRYPDPVVLAEYTLHHHSAWAELHNVQAILRANLSFRSTAFRHAIRLGVTLALTTALYHLPGWPIGRGYWISFTAFAILKPDFNTTLTRSVSRLVGTLGGVILATVLLVALKPTPAMLVLIVAIAAYITLASFFVNYALYSASITIAAVCLLALVTPHPLTNIFDRTFDTLIGGALALFMFLIWPTWAHTQLYPNMVARIETLRKHFLAVMDTYIHPDTSHAERVASRHREARLAYSNVEASLERIMHEPHHAFYFDAVRVQGLLEALNSFSLNVLALEGYQFNEVVLSPAMRDQLGPFVKAVDTTMQRLSQLLTTTQTDAISCADLETALHALTEIETPGLPWQESEAVEQSFLVKEGEQIVHTLEIISQLLPVSDPEREVVTG